MVTEPLTKPALVAVDMRPRGAASGCSLAASAAGSTIVIAILLIAIFLLVRAVPSLRANHANFFTSTQFDTSDDEQLAFGVRDLFMVTALSSITALVLAVPVAVGIAVFLTHYAPRRLSRPFGAMVDLLAAVPSIIFGLWGSLCWRPSSSRSRGFSIATWAGCSCLSRATCRWPAAARFSPRASCCR